MKKIIITLRLSCCWHADGGDQLASEFAAHITQLSLKAPLQHRRPSPLEPPTAAVAAQMDALQINDWPEPDAGVHTAVSVVMLCHPLSCAVSKLTQYPLQPKTHGCLNLHRMVWPVYDIAAMMFCLLRFLYPSCTVAKHTSQGVPLINHFWPLLLPICAALAMPHTLHAQLAFAKPFQCEDLVVGLPQQDGLDAPIIPLPTLRFNNCSSKSSNASSSSSSSKSNHSNSSTSDDSQGEQLVRSWSARECWVTPQEFAEELHSSTYAPLLGCDSWRACSTMVRRARCTQVLMAQAAVASVMHPALMDE